MQPLTQRDYRSALAVVADICSERDYENFRHLVVARLADLIRSDVVSFNLAGPSGLTAADEPRGVCTPALRASLLTVIRAHPAIAYGLQRGDTRPYRLSYFCSQREFSATALYADFYAKIGLRYELSFTVQCAPETSLTIGLDRTSSDFTDREYALLHLVAPHIVTAYRRLWQQEHRLDANATAALEEGLTPREREVLAAAAAGKTNCEIGAALGISARTVQKHVEHIFGKLSVHRRTAAAATFFRARERLTQRAPASVDVRPLKE